VKEIKQSILAWVTDSQLLGEEKLFSPYVVIALLFGRANHSFIPNSTWHYHPLNRVKRQPDYYLIKVDYYLIKVRQVVVKTTRHRSKENINQSHLSTSPSNEEDFFSQSLFFLYHWHLQSTQWNNRRHIEAAQEPEWASLGATL
jgi:hypothetical protein